MLPAVPQVFVTILENILQKLANWKLIDPDLVGPALFVKIRVKFSNSTKKVKLSLTEKITKTITNGKITILFSRPPPLMLNRRQQQQQQQHQHQKQRRQQIP